MEYKISFPLIAKQEIQRCDYLPVAKGDTSGKMNELMKISTPLRN